MSTGYATFPKEFMLLEKSKHYFESNYQYVPADQKYLAITSIAQSLYGISVQGCQSGMLV